MDATAPCSERAPSSVAAVLRAPGPFRYFTRAAEGIDVCPILAELEAAPHLWDQHRERTAQDGGPMQGTSDLWIRYFARETLTSPEAFLGEGRCVFYPAWHALPSIAPLAFALMRMCQGVELGSCLMSRIPAGGEVGTHVDGAAWSARYYNRKFYIPLKTNARCVNTTLDEEVVFRAGEVWEFVNTVPHSVSNGGATERVNLIITLRDATA